MLKTIAKLFDIHQNTVTNWKKEEKKGLTLILKYFTKDDLQEFIEYGTIEKFDFAFANIQNYSVQAAEFVNVLNAVKKFVEFYSQEEYRELCEEYGYNEPDVFLGYDSHDNDEPTNNNDLAPNENLDDLYERLYRDVIKDNEGLTYLALVFSEGKRSEERRVGKEC